MTPEREQEIRQHLATLGVFFTPTDLMIRELLAEIDQMRLENIHRYWNRNYARAQERNPVEPTP